MPGLVFLTDPVRTPDPVVTAHSLPVGTGIIYRHFGANNRTEVAGALARIAYQNGLILLIGADPELARTCKAHGVHWPEARRAEAQRWQGSFAMQTVSAHSRQAIALAAHMGFDAALVSSVFPSGSPSAAAAMGLLRFRQLARTAKIPLYGLGGLNAGNAWRIASQAGLAMIEGVERLYGPDELSRSPSDVVPS